MVVNCPPADQILLTASDVCFGTNSSLPEVQTDFVYGSPKGQEKAKL